MPSDTDPLVGVGTAIPGGVVNSATTPSIAYPLPRTCLSLPRYAQILGINPVHFQGAVGTTVWPLENNRCEDVWPRHSWQYSDQVSHEDLAYAIKQAEDEIEAYIGYPMCPKWVSGEVIRYPRFYRPEYYGNGRNVRGDRKSVRVKYGKFIEAGRRTVSLIDTVETGGGGLAYSDEDGDGFYETATITVATALTEECEIKAYFYGTSGAQEWEIRPARSKTIAGGTATLVFPAWLFIHPDIQGAHPTDDGFTAVDLTTTASLVSRVDVYREYTDNTSVSAQLFWEPSVTSTILCSACGGTGCAQCTMTVQDGCIHVRDVENGYVVPTPATYSSTDGQWNSDTFSVCRDPDMVKVWYYAGDKSEAFLSGSSCDPLSDFFARVIAWLATARIERTFCQCGNVTALADSWRTELTRQDEGGSYLFDFNLLDAPFGTRRGELMAFKALSMLGKRKISVGVL